jgi:hydrogenase maturation protease
VINWRDELSCLKGLKILVAGIGNRLRMDDAIGVIVAEKLSEYLCSSAPRQLLIYSAELSPEDCLDVALTEKPGAVILVDACDCGLNPGAIVILNEANLPDRFTTTHSISPRVIGSIIKKFAGSKVYYLGIQVAETGLGERVSEAVWDAGAEVIEYFKDWE